ncbi:MAG: LysE family transporter [Anaerolineales bacterium]
MLTYLLQGLTLGFAAGAQPGPFQAFLINQAITRGARKTLLMGFAPLISDGPIVVAALLLLSQVPGWFQRALQILGGLFVLYLAYSAYQTWKNFQADAPPALPSRNNDLLRAATMNLLSPGPYIFWSTVIGPLVIQAWEISFWSAAALVGIFYAAMISLNMVLVLLFGQAARFGNQVRKGMLGLSVLALAGFGLYQLWKGIFV